MKCIFCLLKSAARDRGYTCSFEKSQAVEDVLLLSNVSGSLSCFCRERQLGEYVHSTLALITCDAFQAVAKFTHASSFTAQRVENESLLGHELLVAWTLFRFVAHQSCHNLQTAHGVGLQIAMDCMTSKHSNAYQNSDPCRVAIQYLIFDLKPALQQPYSCEHRDIFIDFVCGTDAFCLQYYWRSSFCAYLAV